MVVVRAASGVLVWFILHVLNNVGNGEGLSRAGCTKQRLIAEPGEDALGQLFYGLGLVPARLELGFYLEPLASGNPRHHF